GGGGGVSRRGAGTETGNREQGTGNRGTRNGEEGRLGWAVNPSCPPASPSPLRTGSLLAAQRINGSWGSPSWPARVSSVPGGWRTDLMICPFGYGWCAARFPRSVAGVAAEEVGGARFIDGDCFGGGRDGKAERVKEEDGRAKEEAGAGNYQQAGNGGWLLGERLCRAGELDGRARVAPGPEADGDAGTDPCSAAEAEGADGEFRDVLPTFEGDEGGGEGKEPEA